MRPAQGGEPASDKRGPRSRDDAADIISQDLLQSLLDEAIDFYHGSNPKERKLTKKAKALTADSSSPPRSRRSPPALVGLQESDVEARMDSRDTRMDSLVQNKIMAGLGSVSPSGSGSAFDSSVPLGYQGADTLWMESMVEPFMGAVLTQLGVTDETAPVQGPLAPTASWLPSVMEVMRQREGVASAPASPSSASASGSQVHKERDVASWTRLLADAFSELACEEVKAEPRVLGWRRPGYFRLPQDLRAGEASDTRPPQTWKKVMARLEEVTRSGGKSDSFGDTATIAGAFENELHGPGNIDEGIDQLLEEEIVADEASWLDIGSDVLQVKNQVVAMIFSELLEETAMEIQTLWNK